MTRLRRGSPAIHAWALVVLAVAATACAPADAGSDASSPSLAYGTPAAGFSLTDQFGRPDRLADFHGEVVLLTFIDVRCTEVCPLTADLLRRAKDSLGDDPPVQLLAIDANPSETSVADVRRWSVRHRMLHEWLFLTGPVHRLQRVWASYGVQVRLHEGEVEHSALVYVIDGSGRQRGIFPIAGRNGISAEADALAQAVRRVA